ncbi:uncharacterized protein BJX67DRAFT_385435 [Aspergillus lucknowensis]|uniref:Glycogen debranching enzyme n=1 Tax=Aspergillus lucknowensis TaxID=176173 RepID=A0ABR4LDL7_9EURO
MRLSALIKTALLAQVTAATSVARSPPQCDGAPATLELSDPPYENYFYSDCNTAAQVVVTSPLPDSNLEIISPRLIVAWPGGNSGVCAFFAPQSGINGSLAISLVNSTIGDPISGIHAKPSPGFATDAPVVGVRGVMRFNASAVLTVPILGSIRTIRDFVEGPSILYPEIQDAIAFSTGPDGSISLSRDWLDNVTSTTLTFVPVDSSSGQVSTTERTVTFAPGDYIFSASYNYPQLTQLKPSAVLANTSSDLIAQYPTQTTALSFLSYSQKLLAGAWRFLTYFGRDSMISALLLEPVLSNGEGSAMEAVIGAVLERLNRTDGSVCHEENIGDYATWTNLQNGIVSNDMICDYKMIDTDFFLPVLMQKYFLDNAVGRTRIPAGSIDPLNKNITYGELALLSARRILRLAAPFAEDPVKENLIRLKPNEVVGQWRDSSDGLGGGRIPYDVNTALVPAALRAISSLARGGVFRGDRDWAALADRYAKVWEDKTLSFFEITIPKEKAKHLVESYKNRTNFQGPSHADSIDDTIHFHALALDSPNNLSHIEVMNTDDCFRHFLLNTTNEAQLTVFINQTANNIRRTFPAGLMTGVGLVVANPAYGVDPGYAANFTNGAYHGTVVWSWQLAMMARGLEQQLGRCVRSKAAATGVPRFCTDPSVYGNLRTAYNLLWDNLEANAAQLSSEVWSWVFRGGRFVPTPLGVLPAPGGGSQTESNIQQLWSLTFLAVTRNAAFR